MKDKLLDVIDRLKELDDSDPFNPLIIYAEGDPDADPEARAVVCPDDEAGTFVCPEDPSLRYVLEVSNAKAAIRVRSAWRDGKTPSRLEKFEAVMYYSRHDAFLPIAEPGTDGVLG
jgi:hypothetical protein